MANDVLTDILADVPRETEVARKAVSAAQSTHAVDDSFSNSGLGVGRKDWLKGALGLNRSGIAIKPKSSDGLERG